MFVIGKLLAGLDLNVIFIIPLLFGVLYIVNLLLVRTIFTWLSKVKVIGIIIFIIYCLIALFVAIGMTEFAKGDEIEMGTYSMMAVFLGIAIFSINYFSYTPMFHRTYYGGGYQTRYSHTEHHIFSPDVDYYVEEWQDWKEDGAKIAARLSTFVAIGIIVASLILNVWIVVGVYAVVRIIKKVTGKDDEDLSWGT